MESRGQIPGTSYPSNTHCLSAGVIRHRCDFRLVAAIIGYGRLLDDCWRALSAGWSQLRWAESSVLLPIVVSLWQSSGKVEKFY